MKAFRYIFFALLFSCSFIPASSLSFGKIKGDDYWYVLKQAENAFAANDYGRALALAEEAKEKKQQVADWEKLALDETQRSSKVRKVGDYLDELLPVLKEKNYDNAVYVINSKLKLYGSDFFHGRFSELKSWVDKDYIYPEADFLIGRIYKLEGEFDLSGDYLGKAYDNIRRLDTQDVKYDILYELADLADYKENGPEYEKMLLAVLADDKLYKDEGFMKALVRLINGGKAEDKDGAVKAVEKFFLLYRSDNDISIQALEKLSNYYGRIGQTEKALGCAALGAVAAVTKIEDILKDRMIDYSYKSFVDLLEKSAMYSDIIDWGNDNNIWELFFCLAKISRSYGQTRFADALFSILSDYEPEDYWKLRASSEIAAR
ncbi:MAG: hypothetical protein II837_05030 [Treponema sp.]|nr:hypothetical protein [Treponema sp.]MBQ6567729.1 hypothetical protein [Treponema sp.]MBQ7165960.1 hypothetical protein [Treponema sp.]